MSGDCPNEECHKKVEGYGRTLYGPDGDAGLVDCVRRCIKRPGIGASLTILGLTIGLVATAFSTVLNHGERLVALEQNVVVYQSSQKELKKDLTKQLDEIKGMIKELRK